MIKYKKGDATTPQGSGKKIIVHVCNDIGAWGAGFVLSLSRRWKKPENEYRKWHRSKFYRYKKLKIPFKLGRVQLVQVEDDIWVANIIGQRHIRPQKNLPPVRYAAIKKGLQFVGQFAQKNNASIHMPRIGCGLAGGKWEEIEKIINSELAKKQIQVMVYTL